MSLEIVKMNLGAIEAGAAVTTFLLGVITVQAYTYACVEFKDRILMKSLVGIVWTAEVLLAIFTWIYAFQSLVLTYGTPNIDDLHWTLRGIVVCSSIIQCSTQAFYGYRVRVLSGKLVISLIVWIGVIARFWFFTSAVIMSGRTSSLSVFFDHYFWLFTVSITEGLVLDIINTGTLSFYLFSRGMHFPRTRKFINGFMLRSIEVGIPTCICGVTLVTLISIRKPNLIGFLLMLVSIYPQMYALSLMISLNARRALRESSSLNSMSTDYLSNVWGTSTSESKYRAPQSVRVNGEITVTRTVEIELSSVRSPEAKASEIEARTIESEERGSSEAKGHFAM